MHLNIKNPKHPVQDVHSKKKIILKLNLTFKVKQILKSASNYVSNVLDVTAYMRWCGAYLFLIFLHLKKVQKNRTLDEGLEPSTTRLKVWRSTN